MDMDDFIDILRTWSTEIELRTLELRRCARIWTCIHFAIRMPILLLTSIAVGLMTLSATQETKANKYDKFTVAAIIVNSISIFLTGIDTALGAAKCASASSICARQYSALSSEMDLDIDELTIRMMHDAHIGESAPERLIMEFRAIRAKYVPKQQAILNDEPNNLFFRQSLLRKRVAQVVRRGETVWNRSIHLGVPQGTIPADRQVSPRVFCQPRTCVIGATIARICSEKISTAQYQLAYAPGIQRRIARHAVPRPSVSSPRIDPSSLFAHQEYVSYAARATHVSM